MHFSFNYIDYSAQGFWMTNSGWPFTEPNDSPGETKVATVADDPSAEPAAATEVSEKVTVRNGMEWSNLVLSLVSQNRLTPWRTLVPVEPRHPSQLLKSKYLQRSRTTVMGWSMSCSDIVVPRNIDPVNSHSYHLISILWFLHKMGSFSHHRPSSL